MASTEISSTGCIAWLWGFATQTKARFVDSNPLAARRRPNSSGREAFDLSRRHCRWRAYGTREPAQRRKHQGRCLVVKIKRMFGDRHFKVQPPLPF